MARTKTQSQSIRLRDNAERFHSLDPSPDLFGENGTIGKVLDAARRCMIQLGAPRMSMGDVAKVAGVSRGSIYNHFVDRNELVERVTQLGTDLAMGDIAAAMSGTTRLDDQLARAAVVIERWRRATQRQRWGGTLGDETMALGLTLESGVLLARIGALIRPHIAAARDSGATRSDLDVEQAAEWITRVLLSLFSNPPQTFDQDDEASIVDFITSFCVRGLL